MGCATAGSEAISSWMSRWMSASATSVGGEVRRVIAPDRDPCPIVKSCTLYSVSWSIRGLATT
ncbi:MAG: hypothetical protein E6I17_15090 [Chloroflexi bacterium]|nr:MAG: hypothetical protein E6I17_15090 [Chloroflexota bacterium]